MVSCRDVQEKIENHIKDSQVEVSNPRGDDVHFKVEVKSDQFKDKSLIEQHRMVYEAFNNKFAECGMPLHALQIKTRPLNKNE